MTSHYPVRSIRIGHYCRVATKGPGASLLPSPTKRTPKKEKEVDSQPTDSSPLSLSGTSPSAGRKRKNPPEINDDEEGTRNVLIDCSTTGTALYILIVEGPYRRRMMWRTLDVRSVIPPRESLDGSPKKGRSKKEKKGKKGKKEKKGKKGKKEKKKEKEPAKKKQKTVKGSLIMTGEDPCAIIAFELCCPPVFECFMVTSGASGKKWVRTNDFTMHEALSHTTVKLEMPLSRAKELMNTWDWRRDIIRSKPKYKLYGHARLDAQQEARPAEAQLDTSLHQSHDSSLEISQDEKEAAEDEEVPQISLIDALPSEVIIVIMSFLPPKTLVSMDRVCKYIRDLANEGYLWKYILLDYIAKYPWLRDTENQFDSLPTSAKNWKDAFRIQFQKTIGDYRCVYCKEKKKNHSAGRLLGVIICDKCSSAHSECATIPRTTAEQRYKVMAHELIESPCRRLTRIQTSGNVARWFLVADLERLYGKADLTPKKKRKKGKDNQCKKLMEVESESDPLLLVDSDEEAEEDEDMMDSCD